MKVSVHCYLQTKHWWWFQLDWYIRVRNTSPASRSDTISLPTQPSRSAILCVSDAIYAVACGGIPVIFIIVGILVYRSTMPQYTVLLPLLVHVINRIRNGAKCYGAHTMSPWDNYLGRPWIIQWHGEFWDPRIGDIFPTKNYRVPEPRNYPWARENLPGWSEIIQGVS